jgi:hypothetical protein
MNAYVQPTSPTLTSASNLSTRSFARWEVSTRGRSGTALLASSIIEPEETR